MVTNTLSRLAINGRSKTRSGGNVNRPLKWFWHVLKTYPVHWHEGRSKLADEFREDHFDIVVTVCDSAAEECPIWLGKGKRVHHSFLDPATAEGTEEEVMTIFRVVRDEIETEILHLLRSK